MIPISRNRIFSDPYPEGLKILFIGLGQSSHTHGWIENLSNSGVNIRFFSMVDGSPPDDWLVPTYISAFPPSECPIPGIRQNLYLPGKKGRIFTRLKGYFGKLGVSNISGRWLANIISAWKPDVIHTLGLKYASYFYQHVRTTFGVNSIGKWVVQARGGPDLVLDRFHPEFSNKIIDILNDCDSFIADNQRNYEIACELGLSPSKVAPFGPVPGAGGLNLKKLQSSGSLQPSMRDPLVIWPKAYSCCQSSAYPVLEALVLCHENIQSSKIMMLAAEPEIFCWFNMLPERLRQICIVRERIPHNEILDLLSKSRVMLAPSILDGVPNSLYEAMALGALPIISPLETITPIVRQNENVLFARNLYPEEIAKALVKALKDDNLVDSVAINNRKLVRTLADRDSIRTKVINFYNNLCSEDTNGL